MSTTSPNPTKWFRGPGRSAALAQAGPGGDRAAAHADGHPGPAAPEALQPDGHRRVACAGEEAVTRNAVSREGGVGLGWH